MTSPTSTFWMSTGETSPPSSSFTVMTRSVADPAFSEREYWRHWRRPSSTFSRTDT